MKVKFYIEGMTCASCSQHVYQAVKKVDGVNDVDVNLLLNQMLVDKDSSLDNAIIQQAVTEAGYKAFLEDELLTKSRNNHSLNKLIVSILLLIVLMYISMYQMFKLPIINFFSKEINIINNILAQFILSLIIIILYKDRLINGFKQLFRFSPTMDSLIAIGSISCFLFSIINSLVYILAINHENLNHLFFEASAMVLVFSSIGKYIEEKAKTKTTDAISSLLKIAPSTAFLYNDNRPIKINVKEIKINDILLVKPGGKIPVDGIVIQGNSYCDQSSITGEALPIEKNINSNVISSTINLNSPLIIRATTSYQDSTFSKIIDLVSQAANSKAPISRFVDTVAKYFVFIVIFLSFLTLIVWLVISKDFANSFNYAMSVLTVSCPCALGLATPTAIMVATGKGAKLGIIYKNAAIIEEASKIKAILFDKTNTISKGDFKVNRALFIENNMNIYNIVYSLQIKSNHPLANSLVSYCQTFDAKDLNFEIETVLSSGIVANYNGHLYGMGNNRLLEKYNIAYKEIDAYNDTVLYLFEDKKVIAVFYLSDQIKDGIKETITNLSNYHLAILTGDNYQQTKYIADQVGIKDINYQLMPQDKAILVEKYQNKYKKVAMIGDGINDTIALNKANIAIAVNNSSDVAIQSSDIVLLNDNATSVSNAFALANKTMKIIKENLYWALGYNFVLIPIAAGLLAKFNIVFNPMYSSIVMSLSSITVVLNALRINSFKPLKISNVSKEKEYILSIDHMMCQHCQRSVENALLDLGIIATTELKHSTCSFKTSDNIDFERIKEKLKQAGYIVTTIRSK